MAGSHDILPWPRHTWLGFMVRAFGAVFCGESRHSWPGSRVRVFGYGFWLRSAIPGYGFVARVCGFGFFQHPAIFGWAVWALALLCALSVSRHPLVGLPVAWGCVGVAVGGVPPPPFFFFLFFSLFLAAGGGGLWVWFSALLCRGLSRSWVPRYSPPLSLLFGFCRYFFLCGRWPATSPVTCAVACPGCPFLRPFGRRVVVVGRCFWLGVAGLGEVVPRCSVRGRLGVAFGVAWVGTLPASCGVGARLRGCLTVSPFFPSFPFADGCALVAGWGFPAFRVVSFLGGGLPVPPSAVPGLVHALVGIRCG